MGKADYSKEPNRLRKGEKHRSEKLFLRLSKEERATFLQLCEVLLKRRKIKGQSDCFSWLVDRELHRQDKIRIV